MLTLYGTQGCHLCDEAERLLNQAKRARPLQWQYIDIALDDELVEKYGVKIPVLESTNESGAVTVLHWPFSLLDIIKL